MSWVPLYVPDFILAPSFGCFLAVLTVTKDQSLRTPFFKFFIVTGVCGLSTVVTHILMNRIIWPANFWWMPDSLLLINQSGMMGATLGKFFIALHRYFVLKQAAVTEKIWSTNLVRCLIILQVSVPVLITGICFSFGYVVQSISNGSISYNIASQGQIIQKFISNALIGAYVIVSIALTYLSSRKLNDLKVRLEGQSKRAVLRHQKNMFIVVTVCSLSHVLKAGQQSLIVIYSLNGNIDRSVYESLLWPTASFTSHTLVAGTFVVTNGLATYAPPLILIYCSSRIRSLLFGRITGVRDFGSSEQTPLVKACAGKNITKAQIEIAANVCEKCHNDFSHVQDHKNMKADCIANCFGNEQFRKCLDYIPESSAIVKSFLAKQGDSKLHGSASHTAKKQDDAC